MPTTSSGLAFYETDELDRAVLPYGFPVLNEDDLIIVAIDSNDERTTLTKNAHYSIDTVAQEVTALSGYPPVAGADWADLLVGSLGGTQKFRIYRSSTLNDLVDFTDGAVLSSADLDTGYKQSLFAAQEVSENASGINSAQQISGGNIVDLSITNAKIAVGGVETSRIKDNAVTTAKINAAAVTDTELATDAVTTAKILNDAVTVDKLADDAVDTDQLVDAAVTYDKVDIASTAEMEGQSAAGVVTPDVLKHSPLAPKCYGTVTYSANSPTVSGDFNVSSVTEDTEDERTITFTNALADADYTVLVSQQNNSTAANRYPFVKTKSSTGFTIRAANGDTSGYSLNFVVFGSTYA